MIECADREADADAHRAGVDHELCAHVELQINDCVDSGTGYVQDTGGEGDADKCGQIESPEGDANVDALPAATWNPPALRGSLDRLSIDVIGPSSVTCRI